MCILDSDELTVVKEDELKPFKERKFKVTKTGRTTGSTTGYIHKINYFGRKWKDCYSISSDELGNFSDKGDSGSGVFFVEEDGTHKPLGILIGQLKKTNFKIVCKIETFLHTKGLKIVKFAKES